MVRMERREHRVVSENGGSRSTARRYRQIVSAVARHGLGYVSDALGLQPFVPLQRGWLGHARRKEPYSQPEHLRLALTELGTTFVKLGQILSTRPDLVPPSYASELAKLQDQAAPVPFPQIRDAIESDLGIPLERAFERLDETPVASASIGQAHAANLADGTEVIVKVRRPGTVPLVETDLQILKNLAARVQRNPAWSEQFDFVTLLRDFSQTLHEELDYEQEAQNAAEFQAMFQSEPEVRIPVVYGEFSTARVMTLERMRGLRADDPEALVQSGVDPRALGERLARMHLKMVFEHGLFHADPHPGNFFIEPVTGRVGLIDFGMAGRLSQLQRDHLAAFLIAVDGHDALRATDALLRLCRPRTAFNREELAEDVERLIRRYYGKKLSMLRLSDVLRDVMDLMRRRHLALPTPYALLFKAWTMLEGVVMRLDPNASIATYISSHVQEVAASQYAPGAVLNRVRQSSFEAAEIGMELPRRLMLLLDDLERGTLAIQLRPTNTDEVLSRLERLTNRLVAAALTCAFIIGLAVLMLLYHPFGSQRWVGAAFFIGLLAAIVFGAGLAFTLFRRNLS